MSNAIYAEFKTKPLINPSGSRLFVRVKHMNETQIKALVAFASSKRGVIWIHARAPLVAHTTFAARDVIDDAYAPVTGLDAGLNSTLLIADTGVDVNHCMFYSTKTISYAQVVNDVPLGALSDAGAKVRAYIAFCSSGTCTDYTDTTEGHGTHVSGIATGNAGCGATHGVQPQARLVFMDFSVPGT